MYPVRPYWNPLAAESMEHCARHHCASFPHECWEMLRRPQRSPGQRMRLRREKRIDTGIICYVNHKTFNKMRHFQTMRRKKVIFQIHL